MEGSAENEVKYEKDKTEKYRANALLVVMHFSGFGKFPSGKEREKDKKSGSTDHRFGSTGNEEKRESETEACHQRSVLQKGMEKADVSL